MKERWFFDEDAPGVCSQIPVVGVPGGPGSIGNAIETGGFTGGRGPGVAAGSPGASNIGAGPGGGVAGYGAAAAARSAAQVQAAQSLAQSLTPGGQVVLGQLGLTPLTAIYNGLSASYFNTAAMQLGYTPPPPQPPPPPPPAVVIPTPPPAPVSLPPPPAPVPTPTVTPRQPGVTPSPLENIAARVGQFGTIASRELPGLTGGLIGETFFGPVGGFVGQQVGAKIGEVINPYIAPQISPPQSYLEFQRQQTRPPDSLPSTAFQPNFNPIPLAPLVGQEYCPDCDPQNRFLRAQKEEVTRDIQRERSQLRQKAIGEQQKQIQRLEEQERLPVEYQRRTDIQESLRQKQQLLAQIDQELQDLENQRYEQAGMDHQTTNALPSPAMEQPAQLAPLINPEPDNLPSQPVQQRSTAAPAQPTTSSSTGPTILCIGCESQYDALAFLNGEPSAKCAVIPPPGE